tara:strand:- start:34 stop:189 length:156 start_codon:yes stop_codon:yes gene_type:complete
MKISECCQSIPYEDDIDQYYIGTCAECMSDALFVDDDIIYCNDPGDEDCGE